MQNLSMFIVRSTSIASTIVLMSPHQRRILNKGMARQSSISVLMEMTRIMLITSGMQEQHWDLVVQHAIYPKNRLASTSLGDRPLHEMVFQYQPDLSHVRIFGCRMQAWLPPQERQGKLADRTKAGRYVGHSDSDSLCIVLDENSNSLSQSSKTLVFEDLDFSATNMSAEQPNDLNDDSFILFAPEPFIEVFPRQDPVQLKAHDAWYDTENHETVSVLTVNTLKFPA